MGPGFKLRYPVGRVLLTLVNQEAIDESEGILLCRRVSPFEQG